MRILGIDFGHRRIGVAVSDPSGTYAIPLRVLELDHANQAFRALKRFCEQEEAEMLVIGLPLNMDGSVGDMARAVRDLCARLRSELGIRVEEWDERLSTFMADRALCEAGASGRRRKGVVDKVAAQCILQAYLDSRQSGRGTEPAEEPGRQGSG